MRYFSAFSGIGGFEIGIHNSMPEAECIGYSEIDKYALQIYEKHFPNHKNYGDISVLSCSDLPDFDLLVGGSPCQDLSGAKINGKGLDGTRSGLLYKWLQILKVKRPKYFILENVASMSKINKAKITELIEYHYGTRVESIEINSALVSAQNRRRLYWCNFPTWTPDDLGIKLQDILEEGIVLPQYCPKNNKSYCVDRSYYKGKTQKIQRQIIFEPGTKSYTIDSNYHKGRRISNIEAHHSRTRVTEPTSQILKYKDGYRLLTPLECERLQTFPEGYIIGVSNTQRYKCL